MPERGASTVPATVLLIAVTIALAGGLAAASGQVHALGDAACTDAPVAVALAVDGPQLRLTHLAGPPIPLADTVATITVDGRPLRYQPPLPFFAARGFHAAPTGAFNSGSDGILSVGSQARLRIAGTNDPLPQRGATVRLVLRADGCTVLDVAGRS
jgi:flagellin-like protein